MKHLTKKATAHGQARQQLLKRMEELAAAGETCLPGLRELSREFGVSLMTVNKAVRRLAMEGRLQRLPRKGNFIVDAPKYLNIGVILCNPPDLSFLRSPAVLQGMLEVFDRASCFVRILQFATPERLAGVFREHALDACVWYLPDAILLPKLNRALTHFRPPALVVGEAWADRADAALPPFHVATDYPAIGRLRAEYLLKRGHRKIAHFNIGPFEPNLEHDSFVATLAGNGVTFDPAWAVKPEDAFARIPQLLDEGRITAAVVNGGSVQMEAVLQAVNGHPSGGRLELLLDYVGPLLPEMIARHPRVKVAGVNMYAERKLGVTAAQTLLGHLLLGRPMKPVKIPSVIIDPKSMEKPGHWERVE